MQCWKKEQQTWRSLRWFGATLMSRWTLMGSVHASASLWRRRRSTSFHYIVTKCVVCLLFFLMFFEWFGRQLVQWCPETLCFLAVIMWLPFQRRPSCSDTQQTCFRGCIVMSCLHWRSILPRYSHFTDLFSCFQFKQSHRMMKSLATCNGHCHLCFWFCHM